MFTISGWDGGGVLLSSVSKSKGRVWYQDVDPGGVAQWVNVTLTLHIEKAERMRPADVHVGQSASLASRYVAITPGAGSIML